MGSYITHNAKNVRMNIFHVFRDGFPLTWVLVVVHVSLLIDVLCSRLVSLGGLY